MCRLCALRRPAAIKWIVSLSLQMGLGSNPKPAGHFANRQRFAVTQLITTSVQLEFCVVLYHTEFPGPNFRFLAPTMG